ncbi:hypothetical protein PybrP1_011932 [[Pythium] brassicae (nom. inval.)]|nr:hypothetical protein PybrP1_011932 [[Pythium] brassicae (nom. inval.)]
MKSFESSSPSANLPRSSYKRGALLAAGVGALAWYVAIRRAEKPPPITESTLHPEYGTTMQVGTNREQQQTRDRPPTKMK